MGWKAHFEYKYVEIINCTIHLYLWHESIIIQIMYYTLWLDPHHWVVRTVMTLFFLVHLYKDQSMLLGFDTLPLLGYIYNLHRDLNGR